LATAKATDSPARTFDNVAGRGSDKAVGEARRTNYLAHMKITKAYFTVPVADMDRALSFYRDVLGLSVGFTSPDWSELSWRDATVALHGGGGSEARESWLGFYVEDLDGALAEIEDAGGRRGEERTEGGVRLMSVIDTEGNSLTVGQQPAWGP
jgi:predicted enzyme related to lactoylglutathione lyase